jgi:hypothetical protein
MKSSDMIKVSERIADNLVTRRAADELLEFVAAKRSKSVTLDFKGVSFMSRSFAHEYVTNKKDTGKTITERNVATRVSKMMSVAKKQGGSSHTGITSFAVAAERL